MGQIALDVLEDLGSIEALGMYKLLRISEGTAEAGRNPVLSQAQVG